MPCVFYFIQTLQVAVQGRHVRGTQSGNPGIASSVAFHNLQCHTRTFSPPRRPKKASIQDAAVRGGLFDLECMIVTTPVCTHTHTAWSSLVCGSSVDACDPAAGHFCTTGRRTLEHGAHREGGEGGHI